MRNRQQLNHLPPTACFPGSNWFFTPSSFSSSSHQGVQRWWRMGVCGQSVTGPVPRVWDLSMGCILMGKPAPVRALCRLLFLSNYTWFNLCFLKSSTEFTYTNYYSCSWSRWSLPTELFYFTGIPRMRYNLLTRNNIFCVQYMKKLNRFAWNLTESKSLLVSLEKYRSPKSFLMASINFIFIQILFVFG